MTDERRGNQKRREAIDSILAERIYQVHRWEMEDQKKSPEDWLAVLTVYMGKTAQELPLYQGPNADLGKIKKRFVQLAAVCMAAIESL
jgi:hypothetical protein